MTNNEETGSFRLIYYPCCCKKKKRKKAVAGRAKSTLATVATTTTVAPLLLTTNAAKRRQNRKEILSSTAQYFIKDSAYHPATVSTRNGSYHQVLNEQNFAFGCCQSINRSGMKLVMDGK